MLRVCQVVANINCSVGGPAVTVPRLAESLGEHGVESKLVTLDYTDLGPQTKAEGYELISLLGGPVTRLMRGWNRALQARLLEVARNVDLIHNHGLWMFSGLYARAAATRAHIPLVISPRGMLEQWSLGQSRLKKMAVWSVFERANLAAAAMFHATSEAEATSIRNVGLNQPVVTIPNGVDVYDGEAGADRRILETKYPEIVNRRWLLFLSRIHPKKGVWELLAAWRELEQNFPEWHLIIAGPDLEGYGAKAREEVNSQGIANRVTFTGMLVGAEKKAALNNAELFVLPTRSENFGIAVAEALASGLPVITTRGAPWEELQTHSCGWWIDLDHSALVRCLDHGLRLPKGELREMGGRGRELMTKKYSWNGVAAQMKQAYEWLLGRRDKVAALRASVS